MAVADVWPPRDDRRIQPLTTSFFSRRPRGIDPAEGRSGETLPGPAAVEWEELDEQQRRVLELLREAAGAPVSYTAIRAAGVEFPAGVVSELELVGVPIERCHEGAGRRAVAGVRLAASEAGVASSPTSGNPQAPPAHREPFSGGAKAGPPVPRRRPPLVPGGRRPIRTRMIALAALAIAVVLVVALGAIGTAPDRGHAVAAGEHAAAHTHAPASAGAKRVASAPARRARRKAAAPERRKRTRPAHPSKAAPTPVPTPVSPALATTLEAQGHDLLESGSYSAAIPVLRRAVAATGESLTACLEPVDENCLTYAYALYDLGRALTLGGDPRAAVPILEDRLEIDNQRPVVAAELSAARDAEAGKAPAGRD